MTQATPIPFLSLEDVHDIKQPLQEVELPRVEAPQLSEISPLHELTAVEKLLITRRLRVKSISLFRGRKYKFLVRTGDGSMIYAVEEDNSWWVGYLCYGLRPMQLRVRNRAGTEVMRIDRPYACTTRVFPCQLQVLQVFSPPGTRIGSIEQQWTAIRPEYIVKRDDGQHLFHIRGPRVTVSCFNDIRFEISRLDGSPAGNSYKEWPGLIHALLSPISDRFGVVFESDLNVQEKALLLAASMLLDYMYYNL